MTSVSAPSANRRSALWRKAAFPLGVAVVYAVLLATVPARALRALEASGRVLAQVALPLCVAVTVMFLLNLFIRPSHISRFLGRRAGAKGVILSTLAGILSMGPISAWYPLLKDLRDKGASEFHLANFLSNRAVKPFLLPAMVFYFGWTFTLVLSVLLVAGAVATALVVSGLATRSQASEELT